MNQSSYNLTSLHQSIDVDTTFFHPKNHPSRHGPPCLPLRFRTSTGREITITEIGLVHPKYNGLHTNFAFDLTDGTSDYRLVFDTESLQWWLEWEGDNYA